MTIKFTNDKEHVKEVLKKLRENDYYCPCRLEKTKDTKCMCKEFQQQTEGVCHCGLYEKVKE